MSNGAVDSRRRRLLAFGGAAIASNLAFATTKTPVRIFIVCSYSSDYIWSRSTQDGVNAGLLKYGYLDKPEQASKLLASDSVESSRALIRKVWMDTKRRNSRNEIAFTTERIVREIRAFKPDVVMLGDDNAANYIGNQLLGTKIPVVFWGINGLPLKYGLIENLDSPGSNITGVWQSGYYKESLELLKRLVPQAKTFAILACDSETSRPSVKMLEQLAKRGVLPMRLTESVVTNSLEEYKSRATALSRNVDAFFVLNHDTLRNAKGRHVDMLEVGRWYLENIRIPEASNEDQFVKEGMLLTANDSGFNQGLLAFEMVRLILEQGLNPARMAVRTPDRGPYLVNRMRANQLGIDLSRSMYIIDEIIETSAALRG
jgi:hypothetical protein